MASRFTYFEQPKANQIEVFRGEVVCFGALHERIGCEMGGHGSGTVG